MDIRSLIIRDLLKKNGIAVDDQSLNDPEYDQAVAESNAPTRWNEAIGQGLSAFGDATVSSTGRDSNFLDKSIGAGQGRRKDIINNYLMKKKLGQENVNDALGALKIKQDDERNALERSKYDDEMKFNREKFDTESKLNREKMDLEYKKVANESLKKSQADKSKDVPGWINKSGIDIDDVEARKLREGWAEYETFKEGLSQYKDMIKKYGTTEIFDRDAAAQMNAMASNLQLKIKNIAQLGVLSKSDIPYMTNQIPDPGIFKTRAGMEGALTATEKNMAESVKNQMKARGYEPIEPKVNSQNNVKDFNSIEEAEAANLPKGTKISIKGRSATVQ